jgi:prevent-host-death family protein
MTIILVMDKSVTLAEAKAHLSALLSEAEAGTGIVVTRHGRPIARITGISGAGPRVAGDWNGKGHYDKSVFAPMTDEEMRREGWPA